MIFYAWMFSVEKITLRKNYHYGNRGLAHYTCYSLNEAVSACVSTGFAGVWRLYLSPLEAS